MLSTAEGGDFTRLLERLAFISELRANGPLERLTIHMTVQANNIEKWAILWKWDAGTIAMRLHFIRC